jgi:steroid delta-isomerase-like uncharacterized protein
MSSNECLAVARAYVEATNAFDYEAVHALRAEDFRGETNGETVGREQAAINDNMGLKAFPDFQLQVQLLVADNDHVVINWIGKGTHLGPLKTAFGVVEATGKRFELHGSSTFEVEDNKIRKAWEYYHTEPLLKVVGLRLATDS